MEKKHLTPDEQLRKEKAKRHKLQVKMKALKKRSDILTAVSALLVIGIVIALILSLTKNMNNITEDKGSRLSKDNAITAMLSLPIISVNVDGNDIQIKNMPDMFTILSPGTWEATSEKPKGKEKVTFTIESGYTVTLFDTKHVKISDGASSRVYKTQTVIANEIATFISDNTTLTAEDLSSLISQTKEVFYNSPYYSDYIAAGSGLSAALSPTSWTEIDFYPATENPTTTITAWDNVTISLYEASNVSVVIFNGNTVYYNYPKEVVADVQEYIIRTVSSASADIKTKLSSYHELKLKTASNQYTVIPDEAFSSMLSFDQWRRLLESPYLPASPTYDITDGTEFSLRFFKSDCIVEVNGGEQYYSVPLNTIVQIELYIQKATTPPPPPVVETPDENDPPIEEQDTVMTAFIQKLTAEEVALGKFSVKTPDIAATLDIKEDFRLLLNLQLWQKATLPESFNSESAKSITFKFADENYFVIYPEFNIAEVYISENEKATYLCPTNMASQIEAYTTANAIEEAITITEADLVALVSAQNQLHVALYQGVSTAFANGEKSTVSDISKWIASLSIKALDQKPVVSADKKTVLTFDGERNTVLTFATLSDGTAVLNVYSKNDEDGSVTDVWFTIQNKQYQTVCDEISAYMTVMVNAVAFGFADAIEKGDIEAISKYIKVDDMGKWGYDNFFSATVSEATVQATDIAGIYDLVITVSNTKKSSLKEGENELRMTISYNQSSEELYISSLKFVDDMDNSADLEKEEIADILTFISRCTKLPFGAPSEIDTNALINYCMFLTRKYVDSSKTEFTQTEINAAANRYFQLSTLSDATSPYFNAEKGVYVFSGSAAVTPSITVIKDESDNDIYTVTIAHTEDPLGLFLSAPITYKMQRISVTESTVVEGEDGTPTTVEKNYAYYVYISAMPTPQAS